MRMVVRYIITASNKYVHNDEAEIWIITCYLKVTMATTQRMAYILETKALYFSVVITKLLRTCNTRCAESYVGHHTTPYYRQQLK